jgi:hypothetical protein
MNTPSLIFGRLCMFIPILLLLASCASSPTAPMLHKAPTEAQLLAMIKSIVELPLNDLQNAEKVIGLSRLPFFEEIERNGKNGVARSFSVHERGAAIASATYWYRMPIQPDRTAVYYSFQIDQNQVCVTRTSVAKMFGNIWLTGFRNDVMPGAVARLIKSDEHHFGLMRYTPTNERSNSFMFNLNQPECVSSFSLNEGRDK